MGSEIQKEGLTFDRSGDIPFLFGGRGEERYAGMDLEVNLMSVCMYFFPNLSVSEGFRSLAENNDKARGVGGFPGGSVVKNHPVNVGDTGSIPGSERFPWKRKWEPIPIFLPGKSHGQRNLAGYSPWGLKRVRQDLLSIQQRRVGGLSSKGEVRNHCSRSRPMNAFSSASDKGPPSEI